MEKCQDDINNKRVVLWGRINIAWAKRVYNVHSRGQCRMEGGSLDLPLGEPSSSKQSITAQSGAPWHAMAGTCNVGTATCEPTAARVLGFGGRITYLPIFGSNESNLRRLQNIHITCQYYTIVLSMSILVLELCYL